MIGKEDAKLLQVMVPFSSRGLEGRPALQYDTQSSAGVLVPPSHWEWPGAPISHEDTATICCREKESPGQLSFPLASKSCFSVGTMLLHLLPLSWDEQDWLVEGVEGDTQQ